MANMTAIGKALGVVLPMVEVLDFRATTTGDSFQLDLGAPLRVVDATLDGLPVETEHDGKDLVVHAAVEADRTYTFVGPSASFAIDSSTISVTSGVL